MRLSRCGLFHQILVPLLGVLAPAVIIPEDGLAQIEIVEASAISRHGNKLIIVSDNDDGAYYEYRIDGLKINRKLTLNDQTRITKHRIIGSSLPVDFEGVGVLPDGTVAAVSERLGSLIAGDRTICTYLLQYGEYANRGLEGLAVRSHASNEKNPVEVAVLWEGGYPSRRDLPIGVEEVADHALFPVIIHHQIALEGAVGSRQNLDSHYVAGERTSIPLDMGSLSGWLDRKLPRGGEPGAFRFRAPDLVWHKNGFIVLLSSSRSPR